MQRVRVVHQKEHVERAKDRVDLVGRIELGDQGKFVHVVENKLLLSGEHLRRGCGPHHPQIKPRTG